MIMVNMSQSLLLSRSVYSLPLRDILYLVEQKTRVTRALNCKQKGNSEKKNCYQRLTPREKTTPFVLSSHTDRGAIVAFVAFICVYTFVLKPNASVLRAALSKWSGSDYKLRSLSGSSSHAASQIVPAFLLNWLGRLRMCRGQIMQQSNVSAPI